MKIHSNNIEKRDFLFEDIYFWHAIFNIGRFDMKKEYILKKILDDSSA